MKKRIDPLLCSSQSQLFMDLTMDVASMVRRTGCQGDRVIQAGLGDSDHEWVL